MPERQPQDLLGLPSSLWVALLLGAAGIFALTQTALQDMRPRNAAPAIVEHASADQQNVEARLWEDPFSALDTALSATDPPPGLSSGKLNEMMQGAATQNGKTLLLGVMLTGAPYVEDSEARRRARYAVLAGLYRSGFVPVNPNHLGYFGAQSPYFDFGAQSPQKERTHDTVVFEWFKREDSADEHRVLLLWLDQDGFRHAPIRTLSSRFDAILGFAYSEISVLGPADSDGLREMYDELKASRENPWPGNLLAMSFYSSRATASDASVLDVRQAADNELGVELLRSTGKIKLFRGVANDQQVATAVLNELDQRGIRPDEIALVAERDTLYARGMGKYFGGCTDPPRADPASPDEGAAREGVLCFTYLKGLDGLAPVAAPAAAGSRQANETKSSESAAPGHGSDAASEEASGQGQLDYLRRLAQTIAARRDSRECPKTNEYSARVANLNVSCTSRRIRAVGVISSDVYDKLLILQALHGALPSATYFTFDLDARLLDTRSLPWTRQLIVGSSLGLSLSPDLQGDIPPFRDTYQTSTFFNTMLAIHRFLKTPDFHGAENLLTQFRPGDRSREPVDAFNVSDLGRGLQWTNKPRIFQIGRAQVFDLTNDRTKAEGNSHCEFDGECPSIAAVQEDTLWSRTAGPYRELFVGAAFATIWLVACVVAFGSRALSGKSRTHRVPLFGPRRWNNGTFSLCSAAVIIAGTLLLWPWFVGQITEHDTRVPTPLFGGANQWTATLVDGLTIFTVIVLVLRGHRKLRDNAESMRREFGFQKTSREFIQWHRDRLRACGASDDPVSPIWIPFRPLSRRKGSALATREVSPLEAVIAQYLRRGTGLARFLRVTRATVVASVVLVTLEALPGAAILRQFSFSSGISTQQRLVEIISVLSLFSMLFLILWATDALLLSRSFLLTLLRDRPAWPAQAVNQECAKTGLSQQHAVLWLYLRLIARRTSCVANLVWYPSFVIALLTIAALTIQYGEFQFANSPIALLFGAFCVIGAAIALRRSAELWRDRVKHELDDERLREHLPDNGNGPSQLDRLFDRVVNFQEGALAPYSEQPIVRAVLVPTLTYGGTVALEYLRMKP